MHGCWALLHCALPWHGLRHLWILQLSSFWQTRGHECWPWVSGQQNSSQVCLLLPQLSGLRQGAEHRRNGGAIVTVLFIDLPVRFCESGTADESRECFSQIEIKAFLSAVPSLLLFSLFLPMLSSSSSLPVTLALSRSPLFGDAATLLLLR